MLKRNFALSRSKKDTRHAKSIFSTYTLGPSGVYATLRPHQMPRGNATSHEYCTDTFHARTNASNYIAELSRSVETAIIDPHQ